MKIYYLTSSIIPSINANTINVLSMCSALSKYSQTLNFFFHQRKVLILIISNSNFDISFQNKVKLSFSKLTSSTNYLFF